MSASFQPPATPPVLPASVTRRRRRWPVLVVAGLLFVGGLTLFWLWRSGRLAGGVEGQVASIVRQIKREEQVNSAGFQKVRDSLPGPLASMLDRLFPQDWMGDYYYREELVGLGSNAVAALIRVVEADDSVSARRVCAEALGDLKASQAIPSLVRVLRGDRDGDVREAMAQVLGEFGDTNAAPALLAALQSDPLPTVRAASAEALGSTGARWAAPQVTDALNLETNRSVKVSLLYALRDFAVPESVPVLVEYLNADSVDDDAAAGENAEESDHYGSEIFQPYEMRVAAAGALGAVGDPAAVDALLARLGVEVEPEVGKALCEALGEARDPRALPGLLQQLEPAGKFTEWAIAGLGQIEQPEATAKLIPLLQDADEDIRARTVEALGRIGSSDASDPLLRMAAEDPEEEVRASCCEALALIGDSRAVSVIGLVLPGLKDNREEALWALGHLGDRNAVEVLASYLDDPSGMRCRFAAAYALAEIGGEEAAAAVRGHLQDSDDYSRHGKACALGLLGDAAGLEVVRSGIQSSSDWQRFGAALALKRLESVDLAAELKPLESDPDPNLRLVAQGLVQDQLTGALTNLLQGSDANLRHYAARALAFFKDPSAAPALRRACADRDQDVREAARLSLRRIERDTIANP